MKTGLRLYFSSLLAFLLLVVGSMFACPRIEDSLPVADIWPCPLPEHLAALLGLQLHKQGAPLLLAQSGRSKAGSIQHSCSGIAGT